MSKQQSIFTFFKKRQSEDSCAGLDKTLSGTAVSKRSCQQQNVEKDGSRADVVSVMPDSEQDLLMTESINEKDDEAGEDDSSSCISENTATSSENLGSREIPACWTEDQANYFLTQNPWLQMKNGRLGCGSCARIGRLGLHQHLKGTRLSREWTGLFITSASETKKGQQTALRKKIWEHRESHGHQQAEKIIQQAKEGMFEGNLLKQNSEREETTCRIFRTAYTISLQNHAFSAMPVEVDMQVENGVNMGRILQTRKSCADICDFLGSEMKNRVIKYLIENDVKFSILIDECTTVSHLSVLSVCIRALFRVGSQPSTIFLELIELNQTTSAGISEALLTCLEKHFPKDFISKNWISFTSDGASTMIGRISGVATQLKKSDRYPNLIVWHCCNHRLELAVGDALKEVAGTNNFKSFMDALYSLYHPSPKNQKELHACANELAVVCKAVGRVLDTRWVDSSCRTVAAVWNMFPALSAHFKSAAEDPKRGSQERAKYRGLLERLTSVEFVKNLALMRDALKELADLSLKLQSNSVTLPQAHSLICRQIKVFQALAGEREAEFTKIATNSATNLEFKSVPLHAGRKVDVEINRKQFYRSLTNSLQNRLMTTTSSHVPSTSGDRSSSEFAELIAACKVVYPEYWPDDYDILFGESEVATLCERFHLHTSEIVHGFREYKDNGGKDVPDAMIPLITTLKTIAISTAECERVFSDMNNTITPIRNSLNINRVTNLLFLHRNGPPQTKFKPQMYVKAWLLQGRRSADHTACRERERKHDEDKDVWDLI